MTEKSYEKLTLLILSFFLLIGSVILYVRHSRPFHYVTVEKNAIKEEYTLQKVEEMIKEERRIDINKATQEEITLIPGIGPTLSERIIVYRQDHGSFERTEDILEVEGIGPKKFEKIKEYIRID